ASILVDILNEVDVSKIVVAVAVFILSQDNDVALVGSCGIGVIQTNTIETSCCRIGLCVEQNAIQSLTHIGCNDEDIAIGQVSFVSILRAPTPVVVMNGTKCHEG